MKRFFALAAIAVVAMTMVSCGTYSYLEVVDHKETSVQALPFTNHNIMTTPFVADLKLVDSTMVEIAVTEPFQDYTVTSNLIKLIPDFKKIALAEAVKELREKNKMDVDVLLGVLFDVETVFPAGKEMPGQLKIIVRGYPAKYTKFRTATKDDVDLIWKASASQHSQEKEGVIEAPDSRTTFMRESVQYVR